MRSVVAACAAVAVVFAAGCGSDAGSSVETVTPNAPDSPETSAVEPESGTDTEVTFTSGPLTLHGSLRMPDDVDGDVPGVLLIAGSGPTDRNGNNALLPGDIGTMSFLADEFARNGYASLRFDKLGTGATGVGPYTQEDIGNLGFDALIGEAADGLRFLASQDRIDDNRLGIVGHSEGALIALAIATGKSGDVPAVDRIGLVQPLSVRILDGLSRQVNEQIDAATASGRLPQADADSLRNSLTEVVDQLRSDGTLPENVPVVLQNAGLVPTNAKALAGEDALDPLVLADEVPDDTAVLTSCSTKDIQVRCDDVAQLDGALEQTDLKTVELTDTNHVLKVVGDGQSTGAEYVQDLPYSPDFASALADWLKEN